MKLNLPNRLTVLRLLLVPVFVVILAVFGNELWAKIAGLAIFCVASYTDHLDGKIARRDNLITDFGKFLDPLADKFMVIGAMLVILYRAMSGDEQNKIFCAVFFVGVLIVFFRELAVTSMRLVVSSSSGIVIAANMLGKIKTVSQIVCVIVCLLESILYWHIGALENMQKIMPASIATTAIMAFFTLLSGIKYIKGYWAYLDPQK